MTRADLNKRPGDVSAMFDRVAERYDLLNDVLSLGQDRWWRRVVARIAGARAGERVGAQCVACDFSLGMLQVGARAHARTVSFVAGDALRLPFADQTFDVVTISFGLRNVADPDVALAEMLRVTKPGGRLVICEFGHLPWRQLNMLYEHYLSTALPAVARRLSRNPDAYSYLAESIKDWPAQAGVARRMAAAGWSAVRWRDLTMGVVTVHVARRPA
jgi:demethylmenaquinone methyltransferase/2-methoxy-6-polyprenyl-1,4-benzoquinol methylase